MASSSVSKGMTASTGPNTSSQATVMVGLTPVSTVGWTKKPPSRSSARPPAATVAPSLAAEARNDRTLRDCGSGVAQPDRGGPVRDARHQVVVNASGYQQPRAGHAGLPGGREHPGQDPVAGRVEVGVVEDHVGGLAAQLK